MCEACGVNLRRRRRRCVDKEEEFIAETVLIKSLQSITIRKKERWRTIGASSAPGNKKWGQKDYKQIIAITCTLSNQRKRRSVCDNLCLTGTDNNVWHCNWYRLICAFSVWNVEINWRRKRNKSGRSVIVGEIINCRWLFSSEICVWSRGFGIIWNKGESGRREIMQMDEPFSVVKII